DDRLLRSGGRANVEVARTDHTDRDQCAIVSGAPSRRAHGAGENCISGTVDVGGLRAAATRKGNGSQRIAAHLKVHTADVLNDANYLCVTQIIVKSDGYRAITGDDSSADIRSAAPWAGADRNRVSL